MRGAIAVLAAGAAVAAAGAQTPDIAAQIRAHKTAAKQIAGVRWNGTLSRLCVVPDNRVPRPGGLLAAAPVPPRSAWFAQPYKVFDNLYWVGTKVYSAWALKTPQGIILIDTLYAYAAEEEIIGGLKKLGLDPRTIKYVIVSHAHGDHDESAGMLQRRYGARVVMSAVDWDAISKRTDIPGGPPRRDIVAADGDTVSLGGTSVKLVLTPGHTLGTLSLIFPVRDKGRTLTAAYSGGTAFNFPDQRPRFETYAASQKKFAAAAAAAGATVLLSNHTQFDGAHDLARAAQLPRASGEAHPFEVGADAVASYFAMAAECAEAAKLDAPRRWRPPAGAGKGKKRRGKRPPCRDSKVLPGRTEPLFRSARRTPFLRFSGSGRDLTLSGHKMGAEQPTSGVGHGFYLERGARNAYQC